MNGAVLGGAIELENILARAEIPSMIPVIKRLWPICRSLTGPGVRETLDILGEDIQVERRAVASGTTIFDWQVPPEWRIRDAYVLNDAGDRIIDFRRNNLHVVGYSEPIDTILTLAQLQSHLHSIPDQPEAIPYITSYYRKTWGFCLSHQQRQSLQPGKYRCVIESELDPNGQLDFGQVRISGSSSQEIFFSTYICHPSMANNELSGPAVQHALLSILSALSERRLSYRAAFTTETLGTLCYLNSVKDEIERFMLAGYVISSVGDDGNFTYVRSLRDHSWADRIFEHVVKYSNDGRNISIRDFSVIGSDERQYCSPGFNLPVGSFSRSRFQDSKEYHTSLDNLDFISEVGLQRSLRLMLRVCQAFEMNVIPKRANPYGEPQMGKRGLYSSNRTGISDATENMMILCAFADGKRTMIDIAERVAKPIWELLHPLVTLTATGVLSIS